MSGGSLFDYSYPNLECADGRWMDEELNELYRDLFVGGEFSARVTRDMMRVQCSGCLHATAYHGPILGTARECALKAAAEWNRRAEGEER